MDITLNFFNKSNDANGSSIVIFQKPTNPDWNELAVAWKVIKNCGNGDYHPFTYPMDMQIAISDSFGNYTQPMLADNGETFSVTLGNSGTTLSRTQIDASPNEIDVRNDLSVGAASAWIYKGGKKLAFKSGISPGQKAVFEFEPTIWIGVASEVEEGDVMDSAILSSLNTQIPLMGVASADICMYGGGNTATARAFSFKLENIQLC
jgi:hypothetical protein